MTSSPIAPHSDVIQSWNWYHLKARMRLPISVLRNFLRIWSRFHVIGLFMQTGNDVIVVSAIRWRHRKIKMADLERLTSTFYLNVLTVFRYLSSFLSYYTFLFNMGNPYLRGKFWGFWTLIYPKMVRGHLDPPKALPWTRPRVLSYYSHTCDLPSDL